jgi:hypothetical protein
LPDPYRCRCAPCPTETYQAAYDQPACIPWQRCNATAYETELPTNTTDRVCDACTVCDVEQGEVELYTCEAKVDRVCERCKAGHFNSRYGGARGGDATLLNSCKACQVCARYEYQHQECNATHNRLCASCPRATYLANSLAATEEDACAPHGEVCECSTHYESVAAGLYNARVCVLKVRCAFFGRSLHSRMPLDPTPARLKLLQTCDQWLSSRKFTFLTSSACELRPNTEGSVQCCHRV